MVLSGLLISIPYRILWRLQKLTGLLKDLVVYVDHEHDYAIMEYMLRHLGRPYTLVAKNSKVASRLRASGIKASVWPSFPGAVIMARHAFHRFPEPAICRIGMRHGPWQFKEMIRAEKYNAFDLFLFVSQEEASMAKAKGIHCGVAGGYPRLDAFADQGIVEKSASLRQHPDGTMDKPTLLFTATWAGSGQSAIHRWAGYLHPLTTSYNILASVHPATPASLIKQIEDTPGVRMLVSEELPAGMLAADFLISDTSSVIAEYCALDKPIITFRVSGGARLSEDTAKMIAGISLQIETIEELADAIDNYRSNPHFKKAERKVWNGRFFGDGLSGHGKKAADVINAFLDRQIPIP